MVMSCGSSSVFPGKVLMSTNESTSGRDSVAVISQLAPVIREYLDPHPPSKETMLYELAAPSVFSTTPAGNIPSGLSN